MIEKYLKLFHEGDGAARFHLENYQRWLDAQPKTAISVLIGECMDHAFSDGDQGLEAPSEPTLECKGRLEARIAELEKANGTDKPATWDGVIRPADFRISTFGGGGAWIHRPDYGVTIHHTPTGLAETCDEDKRSVHRNKATAMERLQARLQNLKGGAA